MKCPYCHIHYMDDERECPMCGTRNPNFHKGFQQNTVSWGKLLAPAIIILLILNGIIFGIMNYQEEFTEMTEEIFGSLERPPESAYLTLDGVWECEETAEELSLSVGESEYTLITPQYVEQGQMEIVEESVHKEDDELELHFYEVTFYPDGVYGYKRVITGVPDSQVIVTMPADEDAPGVDDMQTWMYKKDSSV